MPANPSSGQILRYERLGEIHRFDSSGHRRPLE